MGFGMRYHGYESAEPLSEPNSIQSQRPVGDTGFNYTKESKDVSVLPCMPTRSQPCARGREGRRREKTGQLLRLAEQARDMAVVVVATAARS